jgi:hypothetical protein
MRKMGVPICYKPSNQGGVRIEVEVGKMQAPGFEFYRV